MNELTITVLLVEDEAGEAEIIQAALQAEGKASFHIVWVTSIAAAVRCFKKQSFDLVLLDLTLPDGTGLEVFYRIVQRAPNAVLIILSSVEDESVARQAVERGAYDYLIKSPLENVLWVARILNSVRESKSPKDELWISDANFRAVSEASPLGIFVSDADGACVYSNAVYQKISGLTPEQALGTHWSAVVHPDDVQWVLAEWSAAVLTHAPFRAELRFLRPDGSLVWTRLNVAPMVNDLQPYGHIQIVEDISERRSIEQALQLAENALFEEREHAQVTLNSIGDAVLTTDLFGRVTYLNPVAEAMTGWSSLEAREQQLVEVFRVLGATKCVAGRDLVQRAIDENKAVALANDCMLIRRDGFESPIEGSAAPIHRRDGGVSGTVIALHDVTQARAMAQDMLHLAQHDALTGLPNRSLLAERLSRAIGLAKRRHKQVALLFVDLDYFKNINDSLGHLIGDELLKSVAQRLVSCVRDTDTVSRQGGDEFVILLSEIESTDDAAHVAEKLLRAFALPHSVGQHGLLVTLSIGVSVYPDDSSIQNELMKNADMAMYHAKENGRNNYLFFSSHMRPHAGNGQGQLWSPPGA